MSRVSSANLPASTTPALETGENEKIRQHHNKKDYFVAMAGAGLANDDPRCRGAKLAVTGGLLWLSHDVVVFRPRSKDQSWGTFAFQSALSATLVVGGGIGVYRYCFNGPTPGEIVERIKVSRSVPQESRREMIPLALMLGLALAVMARMAPRLSLGLA